MTVGIITFYNTINYGALLQGYSLQKKINEFGIECEIIQYECESISKREKPIELTSIRNAKDLIKFITLKSSEESKFKKFNRFSSENIKYSKKVYTRESVKELSKDYESFIVGSDQVWNLNLSDGDYTYFLDFETDKSKKNSYAASFGYEEIPDKYKELSKQYLKEFNNITVREESGSKIIKNIIDRDAKVVLDPTMLLTSEEWLDISKLKPSEEKYILLYFIHNKKETFKFARELAKKKGLKLIYINISPKPAFGMKNVRDASPEEFLGLVKNAEYVITGSFHGTVFSINFNKKFFFEINKNKGNYNTRIANLVKALDLEDRAIDNIEDIDMPINYECVNKKLNELRESSICKLCEIINKN